MNRFKPSPTGWRQRRSLRSTAYARGVSAARERGRHSTCTANLKQIGLLLSLYTADNGYRIPAPTTAYGGTAAKPNYYIQWEVNTSYGVDAPTASHGGIRQCPSHSDFSSVTVKTSYGFNTSIALALINHPNPAKCMISSENIGHSMLNYQKSKPWSMEMRHGAANQNVQAMLDGHAETRNSNEVPSEVTMPTLPSSYLMQRTLYWSVAFDLYPNGTPNLPDL